MKFVAVDRVAPSEKTPIFDMADILNASIELQEAFEGLTDAQKNLDEVVEIMNNIQKSVDIIAKYGVAGVEQLNIDGSLEDLCGVETKLLTAEKAQEGLGEAARAAWTAFVEWIKKWYEIIKNFILKFFDFKSRQDKTINYLAASETDDTIADKVADKCTAGESQTEGTGSANSKADAVADWFGNIFQSVFDMDEQIAKTGEETISTLEKVADKNDEILKSCEKMSDANKSMQEQLAETETAMNEMKAARDAAVEALNSFNADIDELMKAVDDLVKNNPKLAEMLLKEPSTESASASAEVELNMNKQKIRVKAKSFAGKVRSVYGNPKTRNIRSRSIKLDNRLATIADALEKLSKKSEMPKEVIPYLKEFTSTINFALKGNKVMFDCACKGALSLKRVIG